MSTTRDINYLLKLYEKEYVKGEKTSTYYQQKLRQERWRKNRHLLLNEIIQEGNLTLTPNQIKLIRYLIDDFSQEFKTLHRRASEECIILAFIFYLKKIENPNIRLEKYRINNKYGLTDHIFEIIICRILLKFMKRTPIRPYQNYTKDEHEILIKEGKR